MRAAAVIGLLGLVLAGCATGPQAPTKHIGPVTGIGHGLDTLVPLYSDETLIYSCSQAGVFGHNHGARSRHVSDVGFRALDLAVDEGPFHHVRVVVGGGQPAKSGNVALLDAHGKIVSTKRIARDLVYAVDIHGKLAAAGCANGKVLLFRLPGLERVREVHKHTAPCRDVCFSPDGKKIASAGRDGLVIVSPVDGGKSTILQEHTAGVECIAFSEDGKLLASGALDGKVRIHEGNQLRRTYQKLGAAVLSLAYRLDRQLFAGLEDGKLVELHPDSARFTVVKAFDSPVFTIGTVWRGDLLLLGLDGRVLELDLVTTKPRTAR